MCSKISGGFALLAATLLLVPGSAAAEDSKGDPKNGAAANGGPANANGAPAAEGPVLGGFSYVPRGKLQPGASPVSIRARAADDLLRGAIDYERWGRIPPDHMELPPYHISRFEITNAQWKYYLDTNFRDTHTTSGQDSLEEIAGRLVKFRGHSEDAEWRAIYALNAEVVVAALKKAQAAAEDDARKQVNPIAAFEKVKGLYWSDKWTVDNPVPNPNNPQIARVKMPKGLKLKYYRHRVPQHWYGWCRLSILRVGREYCDLTKAPAEAFKVPDTDFFKELKLRDTNFAHYPIRDISINEALAFAEWAGCQLPSEYEWERAARGDRPNTADYPWAGGWARSQESGKIAWVDNKRCSSGPLAVDDPAMVKSDSPYGLRHMIGNVSELTRTLFDKHPRVVPAPLNDPNFNYAHIVKGGNIGDRWQLLTISTRTGTVGGAVFTQRHNNRADSVGIRLVRHLVPGQDLLMHSLRKLAYNPGGATWNDLPPHAFSLPRMGGVESVHIADDEAPYIHVKQAAAALAFAPLWQTDFNDKAKKKAERNWKAKKVEKRSHFVLGVLRCDVPLRAGVRMLAAEAAKLQADRKAYLKAAKEHERWSKLSKRKKKEKPEPVLPEKPPEPDLYETATAKHEKEAGLWREQTIPAGEWLVVYWYGFIGLANKTRVMPPDAILLVENPRTSIKRHRAEPQATTLVPNVEGDSITLRFWAQEIADPKKPTPFPDITQTDMWAYCEIAPDGWPGRKAAKYSWEFQVNIPTEKGALAKHPWK